MVDVSLITSIILKIHFFQKPSLIAFRVTIVTSRTRIAISGNIIMFVGQIPGVVVLMALYTTKCLEIARCCMAFGALIPFSFVLAAENRKV